jgi:predicted DCC family thiol-disulfide oxidoreductase YuxK
MTDNTEAPPAVAPYEVEVFYDGECPLCAKEIALIRWIDRKKRIRFTDIAVEGFNPALYGTDQSSLMAEIHGRDAEGNWLVGVEVFRRLYGAIGLGPVAWASRAPGLSHLLDACYRFFAKNRLRFTGRCAEGVCDR